LESTLSHWEKHLELVKLTLQHVKESGLKLTIKKSEFAKPEVRFCGSIVGSENRRIDPSKMKAIVELKRPETKAHVRQALGLFG